MFRRLLVGAVVATVALSACSTAPAAPALTDPKEILTKSVLALKDVKTFHFKAEVDGQIKMDLMGTGTPGALDLKGTTAEGDLDLAGKKIHVGFGAPALLGVTGDIIVIGTTSYMKISLLGPKYTKTEATDVIGDNPVTAAGDPLKAIDELNKFLDENKIAPTKLADEKCGDKDCYHVNLAISPEQIQGVAGGALGSAAPTGSGSVDLWVQKNDLRPAKFTVNAQAGDQGTFTITVTLSNYDAAVTVNPPPDSEIEAAPSAAPSSS
jgi:hypothetical protein